MAVLTERKVTARALRRAPSRRTTALLLALFAVLATIAVGRLAFDQRALHGLSVAGVAVGGLEAAEIRARLAAEVARPWAAAEVRLVDGARTWTTTNGALGIAPDLDTAASAALAFGKTGDPIEQARAWLAAARGASLPFVMRAEGDAAERAVARLATEIDRPAVDGEITLAPTLVVRDPEHGRELDRPQALAALLGPQALGDRTVELRVRSRYPAVDAAGYAEAATLVRAATTPLEVSAGDRGLAEDPTGLAGLVTVRRAPVAAGDLPPVPAGAVAPAIRYRYTATLSTERIAAWTEAVAATLDRPARNASYTVQADGALAVVPSVAGVKVDREAFMAQALRELAQPASGGRRVIAPPFVADQPVFTTEQAQQHVAGMVRIASFETYFPPDHGRWRNIATGAAQFNNQVVAPGETFSFWKSIGPVEISRGYAYSGAIVDGMSRSDVIGGGLCQVSTTLFMAVASAGYQIVERGQHDYFIDRYPLGLDAAVFLPGLDLRWRNDTGFPAMIRSHSTWTSVTFEVFSIPSGRQTVFGPPVETNVRDVSPGQKADPAFPPGAKVLGRDVTRTRTVTENGRVVHHDVFRSRYNPVWGGPAS